MESVRLMALVRRLREEAFRPTFAHEREWETAEQERDREERNRERRVEWDDETERLIAAALKG